MKAQSLSNAEMAEFLVDGYVQVEPARLDDADHDHFYHAADAIYRDVSRHPSPNQHLDVLGDDALRNRIPELTKLLTDPALREVLTTLLGPDYFIHPHCFLHEANTTDQGFHQDGNLPWNERGHYRPHRPDWALLFYYPQAVTLRNGPTEVVPGSQYWTKDFEKADGGWHRGDAFDRSYREEIMNHPDLDYRDQRNEAALRSLGVPNLERRFITVPKGQAVICHYDIAHRGSRQIPDQPPRYMYKFYFARTHQPTSNSKPAPASLDARPEIEPIVRHCWNWANGQVTSPSNGENLESRALLFTGREDEKVASAYQLAAMSEIEPLASGLTAEAESVRRAAAYGLRAMGPAAVPTLLKHATDTRSSTRRFAVFALGNASNAINEAVVNKLLEAIKTEPDDLARCNAAYALGHLCRGTLSDPELVCEEILARLRQGVEPDNTKVAGLARSTVRQSLAYALLQLAENHSLTQTTQQTIAAMGSDRDRYVAGFAREIMNRLGRG